MDTADGAGAGMLLEPRSDALPVEVMPTLELTGVSAQLIVTDRAGILTGGSVVLLFPFGFRYCSSISPGLQVWLRGVFSGAVFRGRGCPGGAGGDSFRRPFPAPRCRRGSRVQGMHGSACWRWCLEPLVQDELRDPSEDFLRAQACQGVPISPLRVPDEASEV